MADLLHASKSSKRGELCTVTGWHASLTFDDTSRTNIQCMLLAGSVRVAVLFVIIRAHFTCMCLCNSECTLHI